MTSANSESNGRALRLKGRLGVTVPLGDQAMVSAANFLTMVMLARVLGPAGLGAFSLAWLVVLLFASVQFALIISPMMSIGPKQDAIDENAYYGVLFLQQAVVAAATFLLVWIGAATTAALAPQWGIADIAVPISFAAAAYQTQDFLRRYFFVLGRARVAAGIDFICYGGQVAAIAWLFTTRGLSPATALWAIAATSAASIVVGSFFVGALVWRRRSIVDVTLRHWRFARWLVANALLGFSSNHIFFIATGALLGPAAVGALRAAQGLLGVVHVITMGLENVVPAMASRRYHVDGIHALLNYIKRVAFVGGAATTVVVAVIAVAPQFWMGLTFGESYLAVGDLIRWLAPIFILKYLGTPLRAALRAIESTAPILAGTVVASVLSAVLAYPLVDMFGITGAAAGMLIGLIASHAVLTLGLVQGARQVAAARLSSDIAVPSGQNAVSR